jgi:predicted PurR-regulated permease PerM
MKKEKEKFLRIVTPDKSEAYVINLWQRTQRKIALWVKGQLILGLIVGVLIYLGLAILGVQYALVLAIAAAILELIPFGILLATVPAVSFAYIKAPKLRQIRRAHGRDDR